MEGIRRLVRWLSRLTRAYQPEPPAHTWVGEGFLDGLAVTVLVERLEDGRLILSTQPCVDPLFRPEIHPELHPPEDWRTQM